MQNIQTGILAEVPRHALYLFFSLKPQTNAVDSLKVLADFADGVSVVVGLGNALVKSLGKQIDGLRDFPRLSAPGIDVPSTSAALLVWLRGDDRGSLLHESMTIERLLSESFELTNKIDAFQYRDSRDLTGYEDGTENPEGDAAMAAAFLQNQNNGLDGSSFLAIQQWVHDMQHFQDMPQREQDNTFGRRISDNEEIDEAPESAHVKRTAQEDFEPEAFVLRRSMPWSDTKQAGLVFTAFGHSFDAFEALLNRMVGHDDGIVDALFNFTHPVTGNYFWCPPMSEGNLDLSMLEI